jgi:hypothetical protein
VLTWSLSYSGLSGPATMAHFHGPAAQGKNGPLVIWLSPKGSSVQAPVKGEATLTLEQAQQFSAGEWYHQCTHAGSSARRNPRSGDAAEELIAASKVDDSGCNGERCSRRKESRRPVGRPFQSRTNRPADREGDGRGRRQWRCFAKGRDFAAWLGLVPKQMSTGDRTILGRISKRGNRYLRTLFMQCARVILLRPGNWTKHSFGPWLTAAAKRLHHNVLATALANKLARIAWTVLAQWRTSDLQHTAGPY